MPTIEYEHGAKLAPTMVSVIVDPITLPVKLFPGLAIAGYVKVHKPLRLVPA